MAEGLSEEKITLREYVIGVAKFAVNESKTFHERGIEETLSAKMTNAMMDVVAEPGFITLEGYKLLTSATNFDMKKYAKCETGKFEIITQSAAETIFAQLGGADKIQRKVIIHSQVNFFLNTPSPDLILPHSNADPERLFSMVRKVHRIKKADGPFYTKFLAFREGEQ